MKHFKTPDVKQIAHVGLSYPEIGNAQIMELFGVSRATALKLKKEVQQEMAKRGKRTWNPNNINTKIAFETWGLDVDQAERACKRLQRL